MAVAPFPAVAADQQADCDGPDVAEAVDRYLDSVKAPASRASYAETLARLTAAADQRDAGSLQPGDYAAVMARWDGAAAATWNRHLSALTSFTAWAQRYEILTTNPARRLERRKPARRGGRSIPRARLEKLLVDDRNGLRERVLWRMLYETAARAEEILTPAAARAHRRAGIPRWPARAGQRPRAPSAEDVCPVTGRGRLSYPRAEFLFKQASKALDPHKEGWTLHQLRHSALQDPTAGLLPSFRPSPATSTWPASAATSASASRSPPASPPKPTRPPVGGHTDTTAVADRTATCPEGCYARPGVFPV